MHFCHCTIIPADVLKRLSQDHSLPAADRSNFKATLRLDGAFRIIREQSRTLLTEPSGNQLVAQTVAAAACIQVYNCMQGRSLPGAPVSKPAQSVDPTIKQAFDTAQKVADFYAQVFERNSVDNAGMTLLSSVHFGQGYNNAFWNGSQMVYGDGDGNIFVDFTKGNDVICHELTHGVTQNTLQLNYANQPGGLNESLSDCFGSMFRQWMADQDVEEADWLIGKDIMGPGALERGLTCLRDMADPAAAHCLAPQITSFDQYKSGMDPHHSSGVGNLAFCTAAKAAKGASADSGKAWLTVGKVWYAAMTGEEPSPNMRMKTFANRTRTEAVAAFGAGSAVASAVDTGWKTVGL